MSQEKKFGKFVKPLSPDFLLAEESIYSEVKNRVSKRFNSPSAYLVNLPVFFDLREYYSLGMYNPKETLENIIEQHKHERLMLITTCSLRYIGSKYTIYLNTSLIPPLGDSSISFLPAENIQTTDGASSIKKITFLDGTEGVLFKNPYMKNGLNQLVFIRNGKYYISMASNMELEELVRIAEKNIVIN